MRVPTQIILTTQRFYWLLVLERRRTLETPHLWPASALASEGTSDVNSECALLFHLRLEFAPFECMSSRTYRIVPLSHVMNSTPLLEKPSDMMSYSFNRMAYVR